jgi:formimidoylglutamate deiminase
LSTLFLPELLYSNGTFVRDAGVLVGSDGTVLNSAARPDTSCDKIIELPHKALLPGFVNAHSHAFQRLIRGKAESKATGGKDFWSWRPAMYRAASQLTPEDVYDVARMAFLEMALAGTTTVGEFHYLHNAPDGNPYDDPNLLSKQVIAAAQSVGVRIVLLRAAYLRSGFELPRDPGQTRFFESVDAFLQNTEELLKSYPAGSTSVRVGVAPHSIRAVSLEHLREIVAFARHRHHPLHMHISEQVAENNSCLREYGVTPVTLLDREKLLASDLTAVHGIHVSLEEIGMLAASSSTICSCPTTERNLGDGILPADGMLQAGIRIALGSDSQAQIDPLEDARELDYHLRLHYQQRAILDQIRGEALAKTLFDCATVHGATSLFVPAGNLSAGSFADLLTVDLQDPTIAGHSADDLLSLLVFSMSRCAISDVVVQGRPIVLDHKHPLQDEIVGRYQELYQRVWADASRGSRKP